MAVFQQCFGTGLFRNKLRANAMPIPDYEALMLPVLKVLADGQERRMSEVTEAISDQYNLSDEERAKMIPSGNARLIVNRVAWAKTYLKSAGLVEQPVRGRVRISARGRQLLSENPTELTSVTLERYPEFQEFTGRAKSDAIESATEKPAEVGSRKTPVELIEEATQSLEAATGEELLDRLKAASPAFFEQIVVQVLMAMGYGGASGEGLATGKSGDGGIDGVIKEDQLGLDVVSIQAKRWENPVGRPVVQAFAGAMDFVKSRKGVIITTSSFTREAVDCVDKIEGKKIVLVDGRKLTELMLDFDVGVTTTKTYRIKEVSQDFFSEDEA